MFLQDSQNVVTDDKGTYLAAASPRGEWNELISVPVAVPDGKVSLYFKMKSLLSGTSTNTPAKEASQPEHMKGITKMEHTTVVYKGIICMCKGGWAIWIKLAIAAYADEWNVAVNTLLSENSFAEVGILELMRCKVMASFKATIISWLFIVSVKILPMK